MDHGYDAYYTSMCAICTAKYDKPSKEVSAYAP